MPGNDLQVREENFSDTGPLLAFVLAMTAAWLLPRPIRDITVSLAILGRHLPRGTFAIADGDPQGKGACLAQASADALESWLLRRGEAGPRLRH